MGVASKVMSAEAAISKFLHDGDCVAFGGFSTNRRAFGLVREMIRQGKRELIVESGAAGGDIDMLIGAGCVKAINVSYAANSGFSMVCRRFRNAIENGSILFEDYSLDVQTIAYHAAALGLSYVPVKNMLGSDLEREWGISEEIRKAFPKLPPKKFVIQDDPFNTGSRLCLIPAPKIDLAVIHVQEASPEGICRIRGAAFQDVDIAVAAKHTIVSCECLVSDEQMRAEPESNTLPGLCVDAVVPLRFGAHPSQCNGYYDYDPDEYKLYDSCSKTDEGFERYLEARVFESHEQYLLSIGEEKLESLRIDKTAGYVVGLRR